MHEFEELLEMSDDELELVDPVFLNLVVAKGIPSLSHIDVSLYQVMADEWSEEVARVLPRLEGEFERTPNDWREDISFFRLGVLCWYIDERLGVAYREDQREATAILYTDASDLFLNGVMDTRRGTCGNMASLYLSLAWRLGWPVSLARAGFHLLARYESGHVSYNIETTNTGKGGFSAPPDEYFIRTFSYSRQGHFVGVDLRTLKPREVLGVFVGARGRHNNDCGRTIEALKDNTKAYQLYPTHAVFRDAAKHAANDALNREIREQWMSGWGEIRLPRDFVASITGETWIRPGGA